MAPEDDPLVAALTHRLSECPSEFLEPPFVDGAGVVHVDAVVSDLVRHMGGPMLTKQDSEVLRKGRGGQPANHLQLALVAAWVLHDDWFAGRRAVADRVLPLMARELTGLAEVVPAGDCVTDPDRREELVRLCLRYLGLQPAGESPKESADRFASLDSVERQRVVAEAKKAEERARRIREAMAAKAAEEAAARYGRE
jgi:hypothetical protein